MGDIKLIASKTRLLCTRVEWALKLKGVEYEYLHEDVLNKSPTLLKYNPVHKKVPVLLHNAKPLPESLVILEYIDEVWKNEYPLLPHEPHERANARFWAKFADEKVLLGCFGACKAQGEEKEKAIESAQESLAILEKEIVGKKFFAGEKIGYLDLAIGWIPFFLGIMEEVGQMKLLEGEKFPFLHEWSKNFMDVPMIQQCLPSRKSSLEYFNFIVNCSRSLESNKT